MKTKQHKILVVDDDKLFRQAVMKLLSSRGYGVIDVSRSISVIKTLLKEQPDLMLLDLFMPEAGGMEILNIMKKKRIDIPVIIISGQISEVDFNILRQKGIEHFLAKPVSMKKLIGTVTKILEPDDTTKVDVK